MAALAIISEHLRLTGSLFTRFGLMLTALWAGSALLNQVLLRIAVEVGMFSRFAGLIALMPVVLLQLVLYAACFLILKAPGGPQAPQTEMPASEPEAASRIAVFTSVLLLGLVPFYAYYAGWGLLGDTLRSYAQVFQNAQMRRVDFSQPELPPTALDVGQTLWVVVTVGLIWLVRRYAKALHKAGGHGAWSLLVVACEATWALIGLYVLSGWKSTVVGWLAHAPTPADLFNWLVGSAQAQGANLGIAPAGLRPTDWAPHFQLTEFLTRLFWYALLPVIWFNLGAIIYGHDIAQVAQPTRKIAGDAMQNWQALPRQLRDFIGHFWIGLIKRWHAVTNGILLAAAAGVPLTVSVVVLWRLIDWLGNWAWLGAAELLGPQDPLVWQVVSVPLNMLFNAPGAPGGGLLVSPLQFCCLAAGLELALRALRASAEPEAELSATTG